jgi:hypothetical protein
MLPIQDLLEGHYGVRSRDRARRAAHEARLEPHDGSFAAGTCRREALQASFGACAGRPRPGRGPARGQSRTWPYALQGTDEWRPSKDPTLAPSSHLISGGKQGSRGSLESSAILALIASQTVPPSWQSGCPTRRAGVGSWGIGGGRGVLGLAPVPRLGAAETSSGLRRGWTVGYHGAQ